jgi:hypothetical protein
MRRETVPCGERLSLVGGLLIIMTGGRLIGGGVLIIWVTIFFCLKPHFSFRFRFSHHTSL